MSCAIVVDVRGLPGTVTIVKVVDGDTRGATVVVGLGAAADPDPEHAATVATSSTSAARPAL